MWISSRCSHTKKKKIICIHNLCILKIFRMQPEIVGDGLPEGGGRDVACKKATERRGSEGGHLLVYVSVCVCVCVCVCVPRNMYVRTWLVKR